jgi:hypothetical protein
MKPIAWIRPCESEGAVLEWDKPHPSDCADPAPLYHGSDVDARIAELTAQLEAVNERAYSTCEGMAAELASITLQKDAQEKMWSADLDTADKLRNEVARLRVALEDVRRGADNYHSHVFISDIARNALKEGV